MKSVLHNNCGCNRYFDVEKLFSELNSEEAKALARFNLGVYSKEEVEALSKYISSGPTEFTVGNLQAGTLLPDRISYQELFDKILYGSNLSINAPELTYKTFTVEVTVGIRPYQDIAKIEVFQNGKSIYVDTKDLDYYTTITSLPLDKDTTFDLVVTFNDGTTQKVSTLTRLLMGIFIGIVPENMETLDKDSINDLMRRDPINNKLYVWENNSKELLTTFNFRKEVGMKIAVMVADAELYAMQNELQTFIDAAFDAQDITIDDITYHLYLYKQPLHSYNSWIKFIFK